MPREYGNHIKLNHERSSSETHIEEYNKNLNTDLEEQRLFPMIYTLSSKYKMDILDQGSLGSCIATSYASIIHSTRNILPSRLYLYFNALAGTRHNPAYDQGLDLLQSMPILTTFGNPDEYLWPYNINKFGVIPPLDVYKAAKTMHVSWTPIQQTDYAIKTNIMNGKFIMMGLNVYTSFMTNTVSDTGIIPLPNKLTEEKEGGHGIQLIGWTTYNGKQYYIFRNSWGKAWGNNGNPTNPSSINNGTNGGFGFIPVQYVLDKELSFELIAVS